MPAVRVEWIIWGVSVGAAVLVLNQLMSGRLLSSASEAAARAPVDMFYGATRGALGVPDTRTDESKAKCEAAIAAGNDWEASFYCPAAKAVGGWFDKEWL